MNKTRFLIGAVGCLWILAAHARFVPVAPATRPSSPSVYQTSVSLDQAVAMMQAKYGAKSVRAATVEIDGRLVYEIRLRSADGSRVWTVQVDAATGREI